jgi:hypothetical protein
MVHVGDSSTSSQSASRDLELVRTIADKCQRLVDQAAVGVITKSQFLDRIREAGASVDEAKEYVDQLSDRLRRPAVQSRNHSSIDVVSPSLVRESTPEGLEGQALDDFRA